jgi:membrane protease YdiL (CAAX protease family)
LSTSNRNAILAALLLWAIWALATWFLEGRIQTLLRPEAVGDRLIYILVGNFLIGIVGVALLLKFGIWSGGIECINTGFGPNRPSPLWVVVGIALGLALYFGQGAPSTHPVVIINAYAQVFAVSVAEVLVCWALVGGALSSAFGGPRWASSLGAAVIASILFGLYHFGHSAPFNTIGMVSFLAIIGLVTSLFFFVSRDVYATIAFHNFLGVFGVTRALAQAGQLDSFATLQVPLLVTAAVSLLILIACDRFLIRRDGSIT